jgi:histidinol-phosphatase
MHKVSPLMGFALELARVAGAHARSRFLVARVRRKSDGSVVTDADIVAEGRMRRLIATKYPTHGILGEEGREVLGSEEFTWTLDPIDGTASYALGIPKFGVLIGLLENRVPRLGVIHLPMTNESIFAERGEGCWYRRGRTAKVRIGVNKAVKRLRDAVVSMSGVDYSDLRPTNNRSNHHLGKLLQRSKQLEFFGDCTQHALVAKGRVHVALDSLMQPWDSAAIVPCIQEAGGVVSTLRGNEKNVVFGGDLLSSCSRQLHDEIIETINGGTD